MAGKGDIVEEKIEIMLAASPEMRNGRLKINTVQWKILEMQGSTEEG